MGSPQLTPQCAINMALKAFRQIGEQFFSFFKWETVSPMAQLAISSASIVDDLQKFVVYPWERGSIIDRLHNKADWLPTT